VNVAGSLLLGFLVRYALATPGMSAETRLVLTAGLCGGFTTFSTFSYEAVELLEDGDWKRAGWYIGLNLLGSLAGVALGMLGARELLAWRGGV
jgi:CrcB protein